MYAQHILTTALLGGPAARTPAGDLGLWLDPVELVDGERSARAIGTITIRSEAC